MKRSVTATQRIAQIRADYVAILRSARFEQSAYARVYLGSRLYTPLALLHYILWGEARGNRPCPLFDPATVRQHVAQPTERTLFAAFLAGELDTAPCAEFDTAAYSARQPECGAKMLALWQHYLDHGLPQREDPSPDVSLAFIKTAYHKRDSQLPRTLMGVFARRSEKECERLPLTAEALRANQDALRAAITIEVRKTQSARSHANLVYVQTSGGHSPELLAADRDFDLMLNLYQEPTEALGEANYVIRQNGTKVTAIAELLANHPDLLLRYDRVLFLDDDVEITQEAIHHLFATMAEEQLDLAQPALSADSSTHFEILHRKKSDVSCRRLSAVEIMAPALSRRALEATADIFGLGVSGYGIDLLIGARVRQQFGASVAVVDGAIARHARPVDTGNGAYYRYLLRHGIDPHVEMWTLLAASGATNTIVPDK